MLLDTLVPLAGAMNVRDVGGYPASGGQTVRRGMVFRSDHLADLTADDLDELADRAIRTIVDLRRDDEVTARPTRLWPGVLERVHLPMAGDETQGQDLVARMVAGELTAFTVDDVAEAYSDMLARHAASFATVLTMIADLDRVPLLYHCTAGKDRTGLTTALLHLVLGVGRPAVLDDFDLSNRYRCTRRIEQLRPELEAAGVDIEAIRPALSAPVSALDAALNELDARYGGAERYLSEVGGMPTDVPELLRIQLLIAPR